MDKNRKKQMTGALLLLIAAVIWGGAFVVQAVGMEYVRPFTFNAVRFLLGSAVLLPVVLVRRKRRPAGEEKPRGGWYLALAGVLCGAVLCVAVMLQQFGLDEGTEPGKAGFITALYILLVPLFGLFTGKKIRPVIWLCIAAALAGLYLLCVTDGFALQKGDIYVLLCSLGFTAHILVIDRFSPRVDGVALSCIQFFTAGILAAAPMLILERPTFGEILSAWPLILYAGVLSSGVAYTLQIIGQKTVQPTIASLMMSTESVFAVLSGVIFLSQVPSAKEFIGCGLMFAAIIVSQLPERRKAVTAEKAETADKPV